MKLAIGSDHGGFVMKGKIIEHLKELGHSINDCGTYSLDSCHYPLYAFKVAEDVASKNSELGILICTTGEGISIAANKVKGIRCAVAYNTEVAIKAREHNDANVISMGANFFTIEQCCQMVDAFLNAKFLGDRHATRVNMIADYENRNN